MEPPSEAESEGASENVGNARQLLLPMPPAKCSSMVSLGCGAVLPMVSGLCCQWVPIHAMRTPVPIYACAYACAHAYACAYACAHACAHAYACAHACAQL